MLKSKAPAIANLFRVKRKRMSTTDPMHRALELARLAAQSGDVPVGAVIVDSQGQVISEAHNRTERDHDPTGHAELIALRKAGAYLGSPRLTGCDLYVTLEPCPMCAGALSQARIRRIYYGAYDPKSGGIDHGPQLYNRPGCHHIPEVIGGLREAEARELLQMFFKRLR